MKKTNEKRLVEALRSQQASDLASAAPDLLSALKEAVEYLETFACHDEQGRAAIKSANAAIAKAEGVK